MNDIAHATKPKLDLNKYNDAELETLITVIQDELETRRETKVQQALERMREIAEGVGMTPEELLGLTPRKAVRKKGNGDRIVWRHPDNPELVYRGGKKPGWLKELEAGGRRAVKGGDAARAPVAR